MINHGSSHLRSRSRIGYKKRRMKEEVEEVSDGVTIVDSDPGPRDEDDVNFFYIYF